MYICRHCGDRRLPPPHDWAGERDRFPGAPEPHPGGLGCCGDLHDWVPVEAADAALASVAGEIAATRAAERVWVLGAPDPEMLLIEDLLAQAGERIAYALAADGQRVHPGNAYRAVALSAPVPDGATVYAVECGGPAIPAGAVAIDHHRPGDPGYGRPPAEFLAASSIGQVIAQLARMDVLPEDWRYVGIHPDDPTYWDRAGELVPLPGGRTVRYWHALGMSYDYRIPADHVLAAAADHCLAAAYRGECPGVDPDALMRWRVAVRAAHQGRNVEDVMVDVDRARVRLREAPRILLAERVAARDLRGEHVPELPEAAAREGLAYLATVTDRDGRRKVVLGGHAMPDHVEAFTRIWAPREGLVDIYGDPARGFAGGYVAGR